MSNWKETVTRVSAELRHAYKNLAAGAVVNAQQFGDGLIAPQIRRLENLVAEETDASDKVLRQRIDDLLDANSRYLMQARAYKAEAKRLQGIIDTIRTIDEKVEDKKFEVEWSEEIKRGDYRYIASVLSGRLRQMDNRAKKANQRADHFQKLLSWF